MYVMSTKIDTYSDVFAKRLDTFEILMKKYAINLKSLFSNQTVRICDYYCRFFFQITLKTAVNSNFEAILANLHKYTCEVRQQNYDRQLTEDILATNRTVLSG